MSGAEKAEVLGKVALNRRQLFLPVCVYYSCRLTSC